MSLIASVLELDRAAVQALRIRDPYSLHRVIYGLYEDVRSAAEKASHIPSGILYADQGGDHLRRRVLMLANRMPANHASDAEGKPHGTIQIRPIPNGFLEHQYYRFNVIINPTTRNNRTRQRIPVKGRDAIAKWFLDRAPKNWGFTAEQRSLQIGRTDVLTFKGKDRRPITVAQAHIQGELIVNDPDIFYRSFSNGIGRAKAFGCGLLQIVPITKQQTFT